MTKASGKNFRGVTGRTPNQKSFIQTINEKDIIICDSVMGTGKSYIAAGMACEYLVKGKVDKILFARKSLHLIKEMGFSTGDWSQKSIVMFDQIVDYLIRFLGEPEFKKLVNEKVIEFCSASIIRGRSLYRTFYVCEEMQEATKEDWILMLSRLDKESKFLSIGDREQQGGDSGFFGRLFDNLEDEAVGKVRMTAEDIQRSKHIYRICSKISNI